MFRPSSQLFSNSIGSEKFISNDSQFSLRLTQARPLSRIRPLQDLGVLTQSWDHSRSPSPLASTPGTLLRRPSKGLLGRWKTLSSRRPHGDYLTKTTLSRRYQAARRLSLQGNLKQMNSQGGGLRYRLHRDHGHNQNVTNQWKESSDSSEGVTQKLRPTGAPGRRNMKKTMKFRL